MVTEERRSAASAAQQTRTKKSRRIAFRLTDELGAQLDRAVVLTGRNQSDLITEAIAEKANAIIRDQRLLELTDRDMDALLAAIASPPPPNAAMLRSIVRWRERGEPV